VEYKKIGLDRVDCFDWASAGTRKNTKDSRTLNLDLAVSNEEFRWLELLKEVNKEKNCM
jgi:hypothetical protein